jgi:hypothetical protein
MKKRQLRKDYYQHSHVKKSFRKGSASFFASLLGGASAAAAIWLCACWSMGQVRDIYFQQIEVREEFLGHCLLCSVSQHGTWRV